jgi:TetR/AcrR family transcriptional regulator, fatty acid metabolism regulator protein
MPGSAFESTTYRKPEKVEAIIRAAYAAIARKGYARISLRDIALEAGVNKSLLHYYFKDKDQLILAVFHFLHQKFLDIIFKTVSLPLSVDERLAEGFREFLRLSENEPEWFVVLMDLTVQSIQTPEGRREVDSLGQELRGILAEGFREAVERGEIRKDLNESVLASLIIAVVNGLALQFIIDREATDFSRAYSDFRSMLKDFLEPNKD